MIEKLFDNEKKILIENKIILMCTTHVFNMPEKTISIFLAYI